MNNTTIRLYNASGKVEHHSNLAEFPEQPADALALKFNDEIEEARWVVEESDMRKLRLEDAPLSYTLAGLAALGIDVEAQ